MRFDRMDSFLVQEVTVQRDSGISSEIKWQWFFLLLLLLKTFD